MAGKREDPGIPDPKRSSPGTICIGKSGKEQDDDTANPVLKEGAAVYLKEGKVLFFKIREEKNRLIRTEGIYSLGILMSLLLVFTENVYYNFY